MASEGGFSQHAKAASPHDPYMSTLTHKQEQIALRAYYLFIENGCQHGRDQEYWFQAEKDLGSKFFTPPAETDTTAKKAPAAKKAAAPAKKAPAAKKAAAPAKKAAAKKKA